MIAIILRAFLFLIPVVALLMWLKWRMQVDRSEEELAADIAKLRTRLLLLVGAALAALLGLYFTDELRSKACMDYVPAHMENGKLVPGQFKPRDSDSPDRIGPCRNDGR